MHTVARFGHELTIERASIGSAGSEPAARSDRPMTAGPPTSSDTGYGGDGRTARRRRNALAVRTAALSLLREGHDRPSARLVADRSGVSIRSIFRHFTSVEQMVEAAVIDFFEDLATRYTPVDESSPSGALEPRIRCFVGSCIDRHRTTAPALRSIGRLTNRSRIVEDHIDAEHRRVNGEIGRVFARELNTMDERDRRIALALAGTAICFETCDRLVGRHALDSDELADVMCTMLRAGIRLRPS